MHVLNALFLQMLFWLEFFSLVFYLHTLTLKIILCNDIVILFTEEEEGSFLFCLPVSSVHAKSMTGYWILANIMSQIIS